MDVMVNGDVYIKTTPDEMDLDEFNPSDIGIEEFLGKPIENLYDYISYLSVPYYQFGDSNYLTMLYFWRLRANDDGSISMIMADLSVEKKYDNYEDVKNNFIRVRDFLDKATFIGQNFRRTVQLGPADNYGDSDMTCTVLYANDDILLSITYPTGHPNLYVYEIIPSPFFKDGNYEYYGPILGNYSDRDAVYRDILKYCSKITGKRGRM